MKLSRSPQRAVTFESVGHAAFNLFQFFFLTIGTSAAIFGAVFILLSDVH